MSLLRLSFPLVLILFILPTGCKPGATPVESLVPDDGELEGWTRVGEVEKYDAENLWKHINGAAEKYTRRGFKRLGSSKFNHRGGPDALADIYDMGSAAAAKEIFELSSPAADQLIDLGDGGHLSSSSLEFYKGAYFVRIVALGKSESTGAALTVLGRAFLARIESGGARAKAEAP